MLEAMTLQNFTVFKDARIEFSPGINVFIGANATGKTHAIKAAYALLKIGTNSHKSSNMLRTSGLGGKATVEKWGEMSDVGFREAMSVFCPGGYHDPSRRLARGFNSSVETAVKLTVGGRPFTLTISHGGWQSKCNNGDAPPPTAVFIPAKEVLSMSPGFLQAYKNRELAFDETYYDVIFALSAGLLRGPAGEEAEALLKPLKEHLKFKVTQENDTFYLESEEDGKVEAQLAAEGHRKFATLMRLIANGSLKKGDVLFWDEPESNLNPLLTKVLADYLLFLAGEGIQIILATHDFLLTNELSMQAEYKTAAAEKAGIRFFSFTRGDDHSVSVQRGDTLSDLDDNPILEASMALYDREQDLFLEPAKPRASGRKKRAQRP